MALRRQLPIIREEMFPRFFPLFDEFLTLPEFWDAGELPEFRRLAANVYETDKEVVVEMATPGVKSEDINIAVQDNILKVTGESKEEEIEKKKNYYRKELRYGKFSQSVTLPCAVQADKAGAKIINGVLKITLPKSEEVKAKEIKVKKE